MLIAGVDSSTQSCKVVIRDAGSGAIVRSGRADHPVGTEVDPERWWEALLSALAQAGGLGDVAAISIAGQQHGMVALDEAGIPVRPALLWNDTRSAPAAEALIAEVGATEYVRRAGSVPVASFTATKLRWLRDAEPERAARVAAVALPHDWLTWRLLGFGPDRPALERLTTDRSEASGTSYWSPVTESYDRELLIRALGHDAVVPRVLGPAERAGMTDGSIGGVPAGIVVGAGAGDNAAAALGLGLAAADAVISLGTSGTVFALADSPVLDESGTIAGFASADGRWLPLAATLNASRVIDAVAGLLGVDHDELGRLALSCDPGADGLTLVPYLEGERTPNLPDATGTLTGLTLASTTRENLARAAIEGVLCGLAEAQDALVATGATVDRTLLIGGAAQGPAVAHVAAEVFDTPIAVPVPGEHVAGGAAVQAGWVLTGERPEWHVEVSTPGGAVTRPELRDAHRAAVTAQHRR